MTLVSSHPAGPRWKQRVPSDPAIAKLEQVIALRLTFEELTAIRRLAQTEGISPSSFLRKHLRDALKLGP